MQSSDPRWSKFWQNLIWFIATLVVLVALFRFFFSPVLIVALWLVGLVWGGYLAYRLSQLLFNADEFEAIDERSRAYLEQAHDYKAKIDRAIKGATNSTNQANLKQLTAQVAALLEAIEALVERISSFRRDDTIRRDLRAVPKAIEDLEARLSKETDAAISTQLERTLTNRRKQLESLETLQNTVKRAEIQIESTLSQLGTIYSQLLTSQSTHDVADYSRLSANLDEEVRLLHDHLEALREVKLDGE